jgi:hypothetical protein
VLTEFTDGDATVPLAAIGCELALREVYDRVAFPDETPDGRRRTDAPRRRPCGVSPLRRAPHGSADTNPAPVFGPDRRAR